MNPQCQAHRLAVFLSIGESASLLKPGERALLPTDSTEHAQSNQSLSPSNPVSVITSSSAGGKTLRPLMKLQMLDRAGSLDTFSNKFHRMSPDSSKPGLGPSCKQNALKQSCM